MINYSGKENISQLIELERISLMSNLDIQKNLNKQILMFMKNFMASINFSYNISSDDQSDSYLNELTTKLHTSNSNINILKKLIETLDALNISSECLETDLQKYNDIFKEDFNCIYKNTDNIEKFLYKNNISNFSNQSFETNDDTLLETLEETSKNTQSTSQIANSDVNTSSSNNNSVSSPIAEPAINTTSSTISNAHYIENTLIISETRGKVILPYKLSTVQEIFSQNNDIYLSVKDVIDKVFTLPIDYYHYSPIARFKEAFKLVRYKEKGSKIKALALAFELFVNYNLHPAIITACNSLDELDIYLACLEENNLQDFHFFNIIYEIPLATYNPKHSL